MKILHKITGAVLFGNDATTINKTVQDAVKSDADLRGADLGEADLGEADLRWNPSLCRWTSGVEGETEYTGEMIRVREVL